MVLFRNLDCAGGAGPEVDAPRVVLNAVELAGAGWVVAVAGRLPVMVEVVEAVAGTAAGG